MLFIGDNWAEAHHDVEIQDETGRRLARHRLPEGVTGMAGLHASIADHLGEAERPTSWSVSKPTEGRDVEPTYYQTEIERHELGCAASESAHRVQTMCIGSVMLS